MKYLLYVLLLIVLSSCKSTAQKNEKYILGDWIQIKSDSKDPSAVFELSNRQLFSFNADHTVDDKYGYFKRGVGPNESTIYLGNHSKYQITDKSLKIFDLGLNQWITYKILKLTAETLIFSNSGYTLTFERYKALKFPIDQFDKISLSTTGCFGSCPIMNIIIDSNGEVMFRGDMFTSKRGLFTGKTTKFQYQQIRDMFSLVDIEELKPDYRASWTDDETVIITFTKNNKIIKTVKDYGKTAPYQLAWTYTPLRYLYQKVDLKAADYPTFFSDLRYMMNAKFLKADSVLTFKNSEASLLIDYLRKGKICKVNFPTRFKFKINNEKKSSDFIITDGRYYKLTNAHQTVTVDLGFNFYDVNAQNWHWEKLQNY
jgi:hypothetical protein